jgi:hypothetical protein
LGEGEPEVGKNLLLPSPRIGRGVGGEGRSESFRFINDRFFSINLLSEK